MSDHTPGPWTWEGDSFDDVKPHVCPHGTDWTDHGPDLKAGKVMVMYASGYDASGLSLSEADALLIAAAPDLLAALRQVISGKADHRCQSKGCAIEQARKAIAKATEQTIGKEP